MAQRHAPLSRRWGIALMLVLWGGLATAHSATLLVNDSFEAGMPIPGDRLTLRAGSTAIPGWVVSRDNVDYVESLWAAAEGTRSLDLNGEGAAGAISQTVATLPGR